MQPSLRSITRPALGGTVAAFLTLLGPVALAQTTGAVGIGTNAPAASALLDLTSTTKGLLAPRMTASQRAAIQSPTRGLLVFQTDGVQLGFWYYTGAAWTYLNPSPAGDNLGSHTATQNLNLADKLLVGNGGTSGLSIGNDGNVGIGTTSPAVRLDVPGGAVRLPGAGGGDTWFNYSGDNKNYLRGTTILADGVGNVGIGTGSPQTKLQVDGQIYSSTGGFRFPDNTVQTTAATGDNLGTHFAVQTLRLNNNYLSNNGTGGLRIDNFGQVGIGTASPTATLHVAGLDTNPATAVNLAPQATPSASSVYSSGSSAAAAIDGITYTRWSAASNQPMPQWLQLDFGSQPRVINQYQVYVLGGIAGADTWDMQASNNGSTWTTLHTVSTSAPINVYNTYSLTNTTAYRYYRLLVKSAVGPGRSDVEVGEFVLQQVSPLSVALRVDPGTLQLGSGAAVNRFSADAALGANSDNEVPTQRAVKTYVDTKVATVPAPDNLGNHSATTTLSMNGNAISFGNTTRQMLNLWGTAYGIGIQDNTQYFRSGEAFAWYTGGAHNDAQFDAGGGTQQMMLKNGRLGIGSGFTNAALPNAPLEIRQVNPFVVLHAPGSSWMHMGLDAADNYKFKIGEGGAFSGSSSGPNWLTVSGGKVGVGTTNPSFPLDVQGTVTPGNYAYAYFAAAGNGTATSGSTGSNTGPVSIRATGRVLATEFNATSDRRLKSIIGLSNAARDLALLSQIRITDYTMRDRVQYGSRQFKKVIAQEVEQVFPQAVSQHAGFLPDIYAQAANVEMEADSLLRLTLPAAPATAAKAGQHVKLIGQAGEVVGTVKAARGTTLLVRGARQLAGQQVFVFGLEHPDVRTVDYEALAMLNVSATQELARQLAELQQRNARLQQQVATLQATAGTVQAQTTQQLQTQAAQTAELTQRLKALEALLGARAEAK